MQSPKRKAIMGLAAAFLLSFLIVFAFSPHFRDSHAGIRQNESVAVGSVRKIHDLQSKYASAHPNEGFACQLQRLRPAEDTTTTAYDPTTAMLAGEWSGYKFALAGCTPTEKGIVIHYQITAVPITRGLTGVRAFCTDESGTLFYAESGSAIECLSSRLPGTTFLLFFNVHVLSIQSPGVRYGPVGSGADTASITIAEDVPKGKPLTILAGGSLKPGQVKCVDRFDPKS